MTELRWILILLGLALIAAVYFLGRRRPRSPVVRFEPRLTNEIDEGVDRTASSDNPDIASEPHDWPVDAQPDDWEVAVPEERVAPAHDTLRDRETTPDPAGDEPRKIIAVRVAARSSTRFRGEDVVRLLKDEGLEFGRHQIFHRPDTESDNPMFSVASMVEPGSFDLAAIDNEQIPGVTLFMTLPGPHDGVAALDDMLATAQRLAEHLNGEVLDQSGSTLSRQRASNLRDEIIGFQHQLALQQRQLPAGKRRRRLS